MVPYTENKKLKVINFFAGAGVGKSTVAAEVYAMMKRKKFNVEFVLEHCKRWTMSNQSEMFSEQDFILGVQNNHLRTLVGKVDYAVTDTSLLLGLLYAHEWYPPSFFPFLKDVFNSYDNLNFFLRRNPEIPYVQLGRNETAEQAVAKDEEMYQHLINNNIIVYEVVAGNDAPAQIYNMIENYSGPSRAKLQ